MSGADPRLRRAGPASEPPRTPSALTSRDFRFYVAARFLATTSMQALGVAVGFQVYALTHRTLDLGFVGLAQFLPIAALSLVAGHIADRFDRRFVLFGANMVFALCGAALWLLTAAGSPHVGAIFGVLVLAGIGRAFYGPSGSSLLPALVSREQLTNAIAWQSASWQLASIGGPSLGGAIYGLAGAPGPVYAASTVGFVVAGLLLAGIRARTVKLEPARASIESALAGLRYVARHRVILGSISLDFFAVFLGGATALLPVYATDVLHVGAGGLGVLRAAPAVGAAMTAGFFALRPLGSGAGAKMLVCVAIFGAATIVFGASRSFPLTLAALVVLGASDMVSAVVRGTLVQAATPDEMRGRVSAVNLVFIGASNELGEFESGTVAAWIGAVPAVIVGGVGTLLVVGAWSLLFPEIRGVDRLEDVRPRGPE